MGSYLTSFTDAVPAGLQHIVSQKASRSKIKSGNWLLPVVLSEQ